MGCRFKRLASLVLSVSMIVSLTACASKNEKKEDEPSFVSSATTFLDAAVKLDSKKIKKLDKEFGVGKSFVNELSDIADNKYVQTIMDKASFEIDEDSIKETKKKASCEVAVTLPDYEKAFNEAESFGEFEDLISSQKEKKYKVQNLDLEFKIKDGEYILESEEAGDFIEDLYDEMLEMISDFEYVISQFTDRPTPTTTTDMPTATPEPTPEPTTTEPTYTDGAVTQKDSYGNGSVVINLYTMSPEVPNMVRVFMEQNPDMASKYVVITMVCQNASKAYETRLNAALTAGGAGAPDIYVAEADYLLPYSQGAFAQYAAPYSDFIDNFNAKLNDAQIAQYTVDLGTNPDGKTVALGYQSTGGAMIYSSSIARKVFGSDDPAVIEETVGAGSGNWTKFVEACKKLNQKGYAPVADINDLWTVCSKGSATPWVVDGQLNIDPLKDEYLDLAKQMIDNNWTNETRNWSMDWYDAMNGKSKDPKTNKVRKVFAFFGPAWLINYSMAAEATDTRGDWRVCKSPVSFWWGGTWIFANKDSIGNADKKEFISRFLDWVTLDTSDTGLQYMWASGLLNDAGTKDTVASGKVLSMIDGSMDFLGGQNAFPIFIEASNSASSLDVTEYDAPLNSEFSFQAESYARGEISKDKAISDFKEYCASLGLSV